MKKILLLMIGLWGTLFGVFKNYESCWDVVINNKDTEYVKREVRALKYKLLGEHFVRYTRPFTVCNLGSELSCTIAHDFPDATSIIVGAKNNQQVLAYCLQHPDLDNVVLLKDKITLDDWFRLSECEHFDVTIAFDSLARFKDEWKAAFDTILKMGDYVILEVVCGKGCSRYNHSIKEALEEREALLCAHITCPQQDKEHFIVMLECSNSYVKRSSWRNKNLCEPGKYVITSTFDKKTLYKTTTGSITEWVKGINLRTYTGLDGAYPTHDMVLAQIAGMKDLGTHNDFLPCNLVLQGQKIVPIDFDDPRRKLSFEKGFERCMNIFNPNYRKRKN